MRIIYRVDKWTDGIVIGALGATILIYFFLIFGFNTRFPGDLGDARFNQFILEHVTRWLTGAEIELSSPPFFYPFKNTLFFSDTHIGTGLVYSLARIIGAERETAFNIWFAVGQLTSFAACLTVLRRWNIPARESFIGAFIFAFSLPVLAQIEHAQLSYRFAAPFAIDAFIKWRNHRSTNSGINFLIWTALQLICSLYLGLFLILILGAIALAQWILKPRPHTPNAIDPEIRAEQAPSFSKFIILVLLLALLGYELFQYMQISLAFGLGRQWSEILLLVPRPESYLIADRSPLWSWLGASFTDIPQRQEHQLFPGFATLLLLIYGALSRDVPAASKHLSRIAVIALITTIIATLNISGFSLYRAFTIIAGFNALRAITRIELLALFPVAVIAAYALLRLRDMQAHIGQAASVIATFILVIETITFHYSTTEISAARSRRESMAQQISAIAPAGQDLGIFALADNDRISWLSTIDVMLVAQDHHYKAFSGYSGNFPLHYRSMHSCEDVQTYLEDLRAKQDSTKPFIRHADTNFKIVIMPQSRCPTALAYP